MSTPPRFSAPFATISSAQFAVTAPRCKNCHEVQANHLEGTGQCLFSPYRWVEGDGMGVQAYNNDIRKILSDNSMKDFAEHEDKLDAWAYVLSQVKP